MTPAAQAQAWRTWRAPEAKGLPYRFALAASMAIACGLVFVYFTKAQHFRDTAGLLNLNSANRAGDLTPYLEMVQDGGAAEKDLRLLRAARPLHNVGSLARLRLPLSKLKPMWIVRTPSEFRREYVTWCSLYLGGFWLVWLAWRRAAFRGDVAILTGLQLLSGIGLILMVSLRDPLRDTLEFRKFAIGVFCGCLLLLLPLIRGFDYRRLADYIYTPLLAALVLFLLLLRFGTGPGTSDNKVNLGPFQPVEAIKILVVLFLAGYFARNWERLRDLREKGLQRLGSAAARRTCLPVMCASPLRDGAVFRAEGSGTGAGDVLFVPHHVRGGARATGLALLGIGLMVGAVAAGYRMGQPHTVVDRINMWLSPWDNDVHGGDQLAHALWALSTGGLWGSGPGLGRSRQ